MRRADFHYDLPAGLIAQTPPPERGGGRLLVLDGATGAVADKRFADVEQLLRPGDLLVFNDTRVVRARLLAHKEASGGAVELLLERVIEGHGSRGLFQARAGKSLRPGAVLKLAGGGRAVVGERRDDLTELQFEGPVLAYLERHGHVPLPPYIKRPAGAEAAEEMDAQRYQTVFARVDGAVAAPTAGLHFDRPLLERLRDAGVESAYVTLHVGAGTFQPVRVEDLDQHRMHRERVEVSAEVRAAVAAARARGGRVVAVGTTVVRSLESASRGGELVPMHGETDLFIRPGYDFRVVDALITNFHLPESTLLMLVCAFAGTERVLAAYRHAVAQRYRFFSYGDATLLHRA